LNLKASDGADFIALIEECRDGQWCASAVVRRHGEKAAQEQSSNQMCPNEMLARRWVENAAATRGFANYHLDVFRQ
jgi:hypothetical protein